MNFGAYLHRKVLRPSCLARRPLSSRTSTSVGMSEFMKLERRLREKRLAKDLPSSPSPASNQDSASMEVSLGRTQQSSSTKSSSSSSKKTSAVSRTTSSVVVGMSEFMKLEQRLREKRRLKKDTASSGTSNIEGGSMPLTTERQADTDATSSAPSAHASSASSSSPNASSTTSSTSSSANVGMSEFMKLERKLAENRRKRQQSMQDHMSQKLRPQVQHVNDMAAEAVAAAASDSSLSEPAGAQASSSSKTRHAPKVLLPPREPQMEECCGNDCPNCVWIQYASKLADYEEAMKSR